VSRPLALMYHGFGSRNDATDPYRLFVAAEQFERQMDHLLERGSHFLDLASYRAGLARGRWPARSVLITIDDGYLSTLTVAAPVLSRHNLPAVLFALAGRVGGRSDWMPDMPDEPLLTAPQLLELESCGVEVQSHGWDHRDVRGLSRRELGRQFRDARTALEDLLVHPITAFAYPSGFHDARARAAAQQTGHEMAFAVRDARAGRFALRRTDVNATDNERSFRMKAYPWWRLAYPTLGRVRPLRAGIHRLVGSARG